MRRLMTGAVFVDKVLTKGIIICYNFKGYFYANIMNNGELR